MTLYYGATHDLEQLIATHLFVICPNNSGSTFLKNVLATCKRTWNLDKEGQNTFGFAGPSDKKLGVSNVWATDQKWIDLLTNAAAYNWSTARKDWYFQAFSRSPHASIFVEKSPSFLLNVHQLLHHFRNAKFIFMVRDPYAVVEGIGRKLSLTRHKISPNEDVLKVAATHLMTCFKYQRHNIESYGDRGVFFTYETMCDRPNQAEQLIQTLVPELDDLVLRQRIPVKRYYNEMLRNMNEQQISRLTKDDLCRINQVFEQHQDLLDYFHYPLRT